MIALSSPSIARVLALVAATLSPLQAALGTTSDVVVEHRADAFTGGTDGYDTFRIPSVIAAPNGDLLAFAEGRRSGAGDAGDIDLVMRRSTDGGRAWSDLRVIRDDGPNTCGNPCPVVDRTTGAILLLTTHNLGHDTEAEIIARTAEGVRTVWIQRSTDDGRTWSPPEEITSAVKKPDWTWYATGPGAGIQLVRGPHAGRLVIPCDHIEAESRRYYSHVIYSDDHGATWRLGGSSPEHQVNECEVVELADGRLLLNMRNYDRSKRTRQECTSADGGMTWTDQHHDDQLVEPICQASIRRIAWPGDDGSPGLIAFSNPASPERRANMTLRLSRDDARSWSSAHVLHAGPSAYSCLVALEDGAIGCLYEADDYRRIAFARVSVPGRAADADAAGHHRPADADLRTMAMAARRDADAPALGFAVLRADGSTGIAVDGVRAADRAVEVTASDRWHWGSITKSMTAMLVARLVEKGEVAWEDRVGDVLGEAIPDMNDAYRDVTYLHLLSHRSGLPANIPPARFSAFAQTPDDPIADRLRWVEIALRQNPIGPVEETYQYSNNGYIVAGAMLERATGRSWEALLQREVFDPLGLTTAGFGAPAADDPDGQPRGHVHRGGADAPVPADADNPPALGPAGRVHMALADMIAYLRAHSTRQASFLTEEAFERLRTPPFGGDYALGWVVVSPTSRWHNGSNTTWYAEAAFDLDRGTAAAVVVNDGSIGSVQPAVRALLQSLLRDEPYASSISVDER